MIEYVDVVPTLLEAAGLARPDILDGRSFLPVLTGEAARHKQFVFGLQTTRGIINGSDHYGIRSVRNERYRYIRNLTPAATFQNAATNDPTFKTWQRLAAGGNEHARRLVHDYQRRPAEELYDCEADPWNQVNLIHLPEIAPVLAGLREALEAWMKRQGDQGQPTEMAALERMPRTTKAGGGNSPAKRKKARAARLP